ncbi:hypothetical protein [Bradyrhizobium sp.]|uniref:hypothetical protein n=1 Tax=Bradyrhizobium sp. TaxID=376 RepID=UPI003BAFFEB8
MSTARIVALSIAPGAGGISASLAGGFAKRAVTLTERRQAGMPAWALRGIAVANAAGNISEHQAFKRSESASGVGQRIVILTTAQK